MSCANPISELNYKNDDPPSLEYIEDPYYPKTETMTPSLDDDEEVTEFDHRSLYDDDVDDGVDGICREWSPETELYLRSLPLEQIFSISDVTTDTDTDDYQKAEAELSSIRPNCDANGNGGGSRNGLLNSRRQIKILGKLFNRQSIRDVKVTFIDFSKPYLAKISSNDNYKNFLNIGSRGTTLCVLTCFTCSDCCCGFYSIMIVIVLFGSLSLCLLYSHFINHSSASSSVFKFILYSMLVSPPPIN